MRIESDVSTVQRVVLLLAGVLLGTLMVSPGLAHVTGSVPHLRTHLDRRYVETVGNMELFAMVHSGNTGGIEAKRGPVASIDHDGTGTYTVHFSKNFTLTSDEVFAYVSSVNVLGNTCAWAYDGSSTNSLRVFCNTAGGASANTVWSMVVYQQG